MIKSFTLTPQAETCRSVSEGKTCVTLQSILFWICILLKIYMQVCVGGRVVDIGKEQILILEKRTKIGVFYGAKT